MDLIRLTEKIKHWAKELGFQDCKISDINVEEAAEHFKNWLAKNYHGDMHYMARHADLRCEPEKLVPGSVRAITVRLNYLPPDAKFNTVLSDPNKAVISRYALGRDYHKLMRKLLAKLAKKINDELTPHQFRVFVDSAPVLERALSEKSGLGWIGKNTLLLSKEAGSWFFLGEIFTDLPLPIDSPDENACGACQACLKICPTDAFVAPYQLDARKCISYLTIEHKGIIDRELSEKMGNRIYGCDDCQLICPWNRYSSLTEQDAFLPRHALDEANLLTLFAWTQEAFLTNMEGSPIRRIGYSNWIRNIAIALGNAPPCIESIKALQEKLRDEKIDDAARTHIRWSLERLQNSDTNKKKSPEKLIAAIAKLHPRDA